LHCFFTSSVQKKNKLFCDKRRYTYMLNVNFTQWRLPIREERWLRSPSDHSSKTNITAGKIVDMFWLYTEKKIVIGTPTIPYCAQVLIVFLMLPICIRHYVNPVFTTMTNFFFYKKTNLPKYWWEKLITLYGSNEMWII
jgi:hypothetical protein